MIQVLVEVPAGSTEKKLYDEQRLEYKLTRTVNRPYPFPYGFILGTCSEDGEAVDCYILTADSLAAGEVVECQPVGLLQQWEDEEIDHKVLAVLPGQHARLDARLLRKLRSFIQGVFREFPETTVHVGRILPAGRAEQHIRAAMEGSRL